MWTDSEFIDGRKVCSVGCVSRITIFFASRPSLSVWSRILFDISCKRRGIVGREQD